MYFTKKNTLFLRAFLNIYLSHLSTTAATGLTSRSSSQIPAIPETYVLTRLPDNKESDSMLFLPQSGIKNQALF
jgi:hypothetical protein